MMIWPHLSYIHIFIIDLSYDDLNCNSERSELKMLNRYLSNMTALTCLPVENNWDDELTAFNSLAIIKSIGKVDVSDIEYANDAMPYSLLVKPDYFNPDIF